MSYVEAISREAFIIIVSFKDGFDKTNTNLFFNDQAFGVTNFSKNAQGALSWVFFLPRTNI